MKQALFFISACLLVFALARPARAQEYLDGQRAKVPLQRVAGVMTHTYSPLSGLRLTMEGRWFRPGGYLPVDFLLESQQPVANERAITIRVDLLTPAGDGGITRVEQQALLAAGEKDLRVRVLAPRPSARPIAIRWSVALNGVIDEELSGQRVAPNTPANLPLRILAPEWKAPTRRTPVQIASSVQDLLAGRLPRGSLDGQRLRCNPAEGWLDYSAADVVAISSAELAELREERPEGLAVLRRWVLAGGTLWVEKAGLAADELLRIDADLQTTNWRHENTPDEREGESDLPAEPGPASDNPSANGADDEEDKKQTSQPEPITGAPGWGYQRVNVIDSEAIPKPLAGVFGQSSSRGWYAVRRIGFGRVIAFRDWSWIAPARMRFSESKRYQRSWLEDAWSVRHGLQPGLASSQFGNLLIPSVGVAPVMAFQGLVTLFVLVIGPLNYWLLWRRDQLQMLVLTVPLGALLSTSGLLVYAGLADGFGVKARVRSIALIDQPSGEAVTWSRVSHYAATLPDEPAVFPRDTAVYPIAPAWEASRAGGSRSRGVVWDQRGQVLDNGWLPPRDSVQHLIVRSGETDARLLVQQEGGDLRVANQLGVPIELLLVRGAGGEWWRAAETPSEGTRTLDLIDRGEATKEFRTLALSSQPEFPLGAGKQIEQTLEKLGDRRGVRRLQNRLAEVSLSDNLGEGMIDRLTGLSGERGLDLPPRSYVAVTRQSVTTPLGWDSVQELGSFHLVVGRW